MFSYVCFYVYFNFDFTLIQSPDEDLSIDNEDVIMSASVTAADVVTVNAKNIGGGTKDLGSATIKVLVIKQS